MEATTLISALICCVVTVGGAMFVRSLIFPDKLLDFYGRWLDTFAEKHPKLAMPLGLCAECFCTWVHIFIIPFLATSISMAIAMFVIQFLYVRVYEKYLH